MIEQYAGEFPLWLAPTQAVAINISEKHAEKTNEITEILKNRGFRVNSDLRNEKIAYKIRHHSMQKVPFIIVLGDKGVESSTLAIRDRKGSDLGAMSIEAFCKILNDKIKSKEV